MLGDEAKGAIEEVKITLHESHLAWASYTAKLGAG